MGLEFGIGIRNSFSGVASVEKSVKESQPVPVTIQLLGCHATSTKQMMQSFDTDSYEFLLTQLRGRERRLPLSKRIFHQL
jgi:hypothetical protein